MEDQTRSLSEVAGLMGVSERTVRRWIKAGRLKAYKPGRDYRIPEAGLRSFIEESEISPKYQAPPSLEPTFNDVLDEDRRFAELNRWIEYIARRARARANQATMEENPFLVDPKAAVQWDAEVSEEALELVGAAEEAARALTEGGAASAATAEGLLKLEEAMGLLWDANRRVTARATEAVTEAGKEVLRKAKRDRDREFEAIEGWLSTQTTRH